MKLGSHANKIYADNEVPINDVQLGASCILSAAISSARNYDNAEEDERLI